MSRKAPSLRRGISAVPIIRRHWYGGWASRPVRPRVALRPGVEDLEARLVMTTVLDSTFGQAGIALTPVSTVASSADIVAVQLDGKVVVGIIAGKGSGPIAANNYLGVSRYNADGTIDTSFGTGGQIFLDSFPAATPPFPDSITGGGPTDLVIQPDGAILVSLGNSIFRLTASGQLDPTFGTDGQFDIPANPNSSVGLGVGSMTVQADGKIVLGGSSAFSVPSYSEGVDVYAEEPGAIRLTANGALDTTFNGTGASLFTPPGSLAIGTTTSTGVAVTPAGTILVAANVANYDQPTFGEVIAFNPDGTIDTAYGTGGMALTGTTNINVINAIAVQPDGKLVLVGDQFIGIPEDLGTSTTGYFGTVRRLDANGAVDPTFQVLSIKDTPYTSANPGLDTLNVYKYVAIGNEGRITVGGYGPTVHRLLPTGAFDPSFGIDGTLQGQPPSTNITANTVSYSGGFYGLAVTPDNKLVTVGSEYNDAPATQAEGFYVARFVTTGAAPNDYDGDGTSDIATYLPALGAFAIRPSSGAPDEVIPFGIPGVGQSIPAPGDYDGDGKTDLAVYLPALGILAYRPSSGGADVLVPFGIPGAGQAIPAPGDYDGDGKTDVAVYLPSLGILAYRPSSGGADVLEPFGIVGAGQSIPVPGDYDGDGKTDVAVYLPALGDYAYRPSTGGADVVEPFGIAGAGQSIPAPGDYDGSGKTELAVYLPALGIYAYRPASGAADVLQPFGFVGAGQSLPAPGGYDGSGRTDLAIYLPAPSDFAYRPITGTTDIVQQFGIAGVGQTLPANPIAFDPPTPIAFDGPVAAADIPLVTTTTEVASSTTLAKSKHKGAAHAI